MAAEDPHLRDPAKSEENREISVYCLGYIDTFVSSTVSKTGKTGGTKAGRSIRKKKGNKYCAQCGKNGAQKVAQELSVVDLQREKRSH